MSDEDFRCLLGASKQTIQMFAQQQTAERSSHYHKHSALVELTAYFVHLRHFPVSRLLAAMFRIPHSTMENIIGRTQTWLYELMAPRLSCGTVEERMKVAIKIEHTNYTYIIDGSEQPVARAFNYFLDNAYYSAKKKQHSINTIIIINPVGRVLAISDSHPGGTTDIQIVHNMSPSWLGPKEYGLADQGFQGLQDTQWHLHPSPSRESPWFKVHSHWRIKVENKLAAMKAYHGLKDKIRQSITNSQHLLQRHHERWVIVAVLLNDYE